MNKLENPTKCKHDHKWTDKLKVIIFTLLMLAPFIAILSKVIYVTANKNAKDSYTESQIIELKEIATNESLIQGEQYTIQYYQDGTPGQSPKFYYTDITINWTDYFNNLANEDVHAFAIVNSINIYIYNANGTYINHKELWGTKITGFSFTFDRISNESYFGIGKNRVLHVTYLKNKLDNAFYYAVDQIKEDQLFKWVDNTIVYDGLNNMNIGFGLPNNHVLTYLLAYWTILTAIYIVIDIILFLFTKLTHFLQ